MTYDHEPDEGYRGSAEMVLGGRAVPVQVHLAGHVEPMDGRYRWAGRVVADGDRDLAGLLEIGDRDIVLRHPDGHEAAGRLTERDPWGGCRVVGIGRPPFPLPDPPRESPVP